MKWRFYFGQGQQLLFWNKAKVKHFLDVIVSNNVWVASVVMDVSTSLNIIVNKNHKPLHKKQAVILK